MSRKEKIYSVLRAATFAGLLTGSSLLSSLQNPEGEYKIFPKANQDSRDDLANLLGLAGIVTTGFAFRRFNKFRDDYVLNSND